MQQTFTFHNVGEGVRQYSSKVQEIVSKWNRILDFCYNRACELKGLPNESTPGARDDWHDEVIVNYAKFFGWADNFEENSQPEFEESQFWVTVKVNEDSKTLSICKFEGATGHQHNLVNITVTSQIVTVIEDYPEVLSAGLGRFAGLHFIREIVLQGEPELQEAVDALIKSSVF